MTDKLQRLELTWPGKEDRFNPEPRILLEDKEKSYSAPDSLMQGIVESMGLEQKVQPTFDNMLIHGDNLLALKALEQDYAGKVKCIYIDPPYNTGSAFEHYDDGLEHSIWLSLMRDRLEILKRLLSNDGVIFIQIDDNEQAYLKILMDEIFGRHNFVNCISVKMSEATGVKMSHAQKRFPKLKEYILFYKKNAIPNIKPIKIPLEKWNDEYKEILLGIKEDELEKVKILMDQEEPASDENVSFVNSLLSQTKIQSLSSYFKEYSIKNSDQESFKWENAWRIVQAVGAGSIKERAKSCKILTQDVSSLLSAQKKLYLFKSKFDETSKDPRIRIIFADKYLKYNPGDFWIDIKTSGGVGQEGGVLFPKGKKPEALIERILNTVTIPGDLVLDSFLGSGTTAAVAHKMGRRWIGVEMGDHVYTHCLPRLKRVINGEDAGGVTKSTGWLCGGGFKFYELASSLIVKDKYGQQIISDKYNADMLAEAMCKILGYHYKPDSTAYWKQGYSSEKSFIYTTTFSMQEASLERLHEEVGDNNLLVCCSAFSGNSKAYPNISVKKIPSAILKKCEWGREGYPLNLTNYHPDDKEFEFDEENDE